MSSVTLRILSLWVILLSISIVAASPAPIDPGVASSCEDAKSTQNLNTNFALTSASSPDSFVLGAILLAGGVLVGS
ncbi:hypothetical protein BD769DRAFT_1437881 [Suillus cothurnatus]|nr:hypothetical protein BD769DRAFT_1437881 [Suillus cothurnatus]